MRSSHPRARSIIALGLVLLLAGCSMSREARVALEEGRHNANQGAYREALAHFRDATRLAPDSAEAQAALGETAEILGEFDQALSAYQAAARLSSSPATWLRVGEIADRMGNVDLAIQALEDAKGMWRQHAWAGFKFGAATFAACVPAVWPAVSMLWTHCLPTATDGGNSYFTASRERVPAYIFQILVEAAQNDRALALARERRWLRGGADYCRARNLPVSGETAGLLAMLLQPDRAGCNVVLGTQIADGGLARLGRRVLLRQAEKASSPEARSRAEWVLRYRLPDHQVPKLAESLNVTGYQLQYGRKNPTEALAAYQKSIAADPAFSWPYHNIGRLYMEQEDLERALGWLTKAVEVNPNHLRAAYSQALTAHRLDRNDMALAAYRRVLAMDPSSAVAHANLGQLLLKMGRHAEGVRELQVAVNLDPSLDEVKNVLNARYGRDARQGPTPFSMR